MQVNETVWTDKEDWRQVSSYAAGTQKKDMILCPCFNPNEGGTTAGDIRRGLDTNYLTLSEPWDKSLSWCGLGMQHPLSNVSFMGMVADSSATPDNHVVLINQDRRQVTNFAFGNQGGQGNDWPGRYILAGTEYSSNKFAMQRWAPYGNFDFYYSGYGGFIPFTQIPTKRCVLVPHIICYNASGTRQEYDLTTYLQHKTEYKYISQITLYIYCDYNPSLYPVFDEEPLEGFERRNVADLTCISILDPSEMAKGYPIPNSQDVFDNIFLYNQISSDPYDSGILIAGTKGTTGWERVDASQTWCIPVYNGFGFNFDHFTNATSDNVPTSSSRLVCDVTDMSADNFRKNVRRCVACFGMFFVDADADCNLPLYDDKMFLGLLEDGVGNGAYSNGERNKDAPQWQMDDMHEIDYDPGNPPIQDPNIYDAAFSFGRLQNFKTATKRYNLSDGQIDQIYQSLWTIWGSWLDGANVPQTNEIFYNTYKTFLSNDPMDCIVSCKYFPIDANKISMADGTNTPIKLGAITLTEGGTGSIEIQAPPAKQSVTYDCGTVYVWPIISGKGQTWLDNFDSLELYLPFCGSIKLDVATYMGKNVGVEYHIDLITGNCTAAVYIYSAEYGNKVYMEIRNGNCGIDVALSGIQQATLDANLFNATQQAKTATINAVGSTLGNLISTGAKIYGGDALGAVTGAVSGLQSLANNIVGAETAKYNLNHVQLPTRIIGCATPLASAETNLTPCLIHTRPHKPSEGQDYGKTTGYSCIVHDTVGSLGGFTVATDVKMDGITATDAEKSLIRSLLAGGVYV